MNLHTSIYILPYYVLRQEQKYNASMLAVDRLNTALIEYRLRSNQFKHLTSCVEFGSI